VCSAPRHKLPKPGHNFKKKIYNPALEGVITMKFGTVAHN